MSFKRNDEAAMRRFGRWMFNGLTVLSLVLCVLIFVSWYRSNTIGDTITWYRQPRNFEFYSCGGLMRASWGRLISSKYPPHPGWQFSFWPEPSRVEVDLRTNTHFGFGFEKWSMNRPSLSGWAHTITLPYFFLALCFGLPPVFAICGQIRRRRKLRSIEGVFCSKCGYNLTGNVSGVCSECGKAIENVVQAK
jgi:4-amino-4-deoxy-L-arabinose transferase-like glycosyltransferase